jgi:RimJ/RimL family protein N-acetyltransferase
MGCPAIHLAPVDSDDLQGTLRRLLSRAGTEVGIDPYAFGEPTYWLIESDQPKGRKVIFGYTGAHSINWISRRCRGLIWIAPEYRRKGIGEAALRIRNDILFDQWNMNRVEWATLASNASLCALSKKLGQIPDGIARQASFHDGAYHDYALYGILRAEWKSRQCFNVSLRKVK